MGVSYQDLLMRGALSSSLFASLVPTLIPYTASNVSNMVSFHNILLILQIQLLVEQPDKLICGYGHTTGFPADLGRPPFPNAKTLTDNALPSPTCNLL